MTLALHVAFRVAAWATCLVVLFHYYRFARNSPSGFRRAMTVFFTRLALILPVAVILWLVGYVTIDSDETYFVVDAMFPVAIAASAVAMARRAVRRNAAAP